MLKRFSLLTMVLVAMLTWTVSCSKTGDKKSDSDKQITPDKEAVKPAKAPGSVGTKAADFTLKDINGNSVSLSDFKGKVVLVNFWATWCPPCKVEIPDFIQMYDKYKKDGLVIVGITGFRDKVNQVKSFSENAKINYPVLFSEPKEQQTLIPNYGNFRSIPTTFLVDREGIIRHVWTGVLNEEEFLKKGEKYLK